MGPRSDVAAGEQIGLVGITFCQHASVFFYSFLAVFVAKVYGIHIGPVELLLIGVGSYLHSMASAGLPSAASIGFLAAVFRPIGIPVETLSVILIAVLPLIDPFLTVANITGQMVSVSATVRLLARTAKGSVASVPLAPIDLSRS